MNLPPGYRAVFRHERIHRIMRMNEQTRTVVEPRGGTTHCRILDGCGEVVVHTTARCRSNEPYVKSLGRTIAGGRAQQQLERLLEHEHAKRLLV